jgi:UTP--glucose-1-phosphate uridylyltransferase
VPAIQLVVEEAVRAGLEDVLIVVGRDQSSIADHFDRSPELEAFLGSKGKSAELAAMRAISELAQVHTVRQKDARGLGHAVSVAEAHVGGEPFAVLLGDDLVRSDVPCIRQMIEVYERVRAPVLAVMRVPPDEISSYGVIAAEPAPGGDNRLHRVNRLVEKPPKADAPSDLAIIGRYILTPAIFNHVRRTETDPRGEIQLTNALQSLLSESEVYGFEFEGVRHDCGNKLGFLMATVEYALERPDLGGPFRRYLRSVRLGDREE